MGVLGIPNDNELLSMFGYVTDEDRAKWNSMREASDRSLEESRNGMTARDLASKSAAPAIGMAEKSINAQMHGEQMAEREAQRRGRTQRVTTRERYYEEEIPDGADDREMGY